MTSDTERPIGLEASSTASGIPVHQDRERDQPDATSGPSTGDLTMDVKPLSPPLRPLTSLKWPYVPEESAYPDPLKRDDPKPLQTRQYEAIATSPAIRKALAANPRLPEVLSSIDRLRGEDREEALQRALGVSASDANRSQRGVPLAQSDEDVKALRDLAEAIELAVRGGKQDALGLDWGD